MKSIHKTYPLQLFYLDGLIRTRRIKTWRHSLSDRSHILQTRWTNADGACDMASVCCGCCKNSFWCRRQILNRQLMYIILSHICSGYLIYSHFSVILPLSLIHKNLFIVQYELLTYTKQWFVTDWKLSQIALIIH